MFYISALGSLPWIAFAECVTRGTTAFTDNAAYLKKLPVPEQVFVAQAAAAATMGLAISFGLLAVLAIPAGLMPTIYWLLVPLPLIAMQLLGLGIGLLLGTLNTFFRDVNQMLNVGLQIVMWTAPVVYLTDSLPQVVRQILAWHPLVPALEATRTLFLHGTMPSAGIWLGLILWPVVAIGFSSFVFNRLRKDIRDVL